jgi:leukotriene-A4 hydrolase
MGEPLTVKLPKALAKGEEVKIVIKYSTTKDCTAVGWLTPVYVGLAI